MLEIVANYHRKQFQGKFIIQTQGNGEKPHFGPDLGPLGPNSGRQFFLKKIWLYQSPDIMESHHRVQYQKKTNDPIFRKFSDRRTDRQTNESDFIGRCPTNVERPTCNTIPCKMRDSACRWHFLKRLKYFEVMLNIFEF